MQQQIYELENLTLLSKDLCLFSLTPKEDAIAFTPGQYVFFHLPNGKKAPFSMASTGPTLTFHMRHNAAHPVADLFLEHLKNHGSMPVSGPFGECVLPENNEPVVLVAGGTGIAPYKALIDAFIVSDHTCSIQLFWGIKSLDDFYLKDWFEKIIQDPRIQGTVVLSEKDPQWHGNEGFVHEYVSIQQLPAQTLIYASGPYPMVMALKDVCEKQTLRLKSDMIASDHVSS